MKNRFPFLYHEKELYHLKENTPNNYNFLEAKKNKRREKEKRKKKKKF